MVSSITLARILPAKDKEVYRKVKSFKEVKEVVLTYGEYDLVLKIELDSLEALDNFIFNKLRTIDGIVATTTLLEVQPKNIISEDRG